MPIGQRQSAVDYLGSAVGLMQAETDLSGDGCPDCIGRWLEAI